MTTAVLYVLMTLAVLLFIHLLILAMLASKKFKTNSQSDIQAQIHSDRYNDYLIIYASQSGNAENLAVYTAEQMSSAGLMVQTLNIAQLSPVHLTQAINTQSKILWIVSSYGEGDAPDTARHFVDHCLNQSLDLAGLKFGILALGDRQYSHFCQFGYDLNRGLIAQSAMSLFDMICVDRMHVTDLTKWNTQLEQMTALNLTTFAKHQQPWLSLKLAERELLNQGSQGNPLYRLSFHRPETMAWQSGDLLEVQCSNQPENIQQFLLQHQITLNSSDTEQLKFKDLAQTQDSPKLSAFNSEIEISDWILNLRDLPYREYSIASIQQSGALDLVVRQEITAQGLGLGSGLLTVYTPIGAEIQARVRSNPAFHLVKDTDQPMIFIGNGSGIAGLVAHLQQRAAWNATQNWLIFGERQQQFDTPYHAQILTWQQQGILTDVDYAFSRDPQSCKYVQDCLTQKSEQLKIWIEQGASVYVCGSLKGMAQAVDQTLLNILGEDSLNELRRQQRYLRDVY